MKNASLEELDELLSKSEELTGKERARLETIVMADPVAMERYLAMTEIEVLLQRDESIRAALMKADQPENVVSMPGTRPACSASEKKRVPELENGHPIANWVKWTGIAAAIVLVGVVISQVRTEQSESVIVSGVERSSPLPPAETSSVETSPEDQYREALLADVGTGSLTRPPTPFAKAGGAIEKISFNRDVRPILADNCYHCHGPDSGSREAELRLDNEADARAVLAANPAESELFLRVTETDPDSIMPPPESHKKLGKDQIEIIRRWLVEGAEWEAHWAFSAPEKPETGNSIDDFVGQRLENEGLAFAPEADRFTLIRRATLDATGLPPKPDEVTSFIADESPDAYEKLVDRLLDTNAYAEHRTRYWLDAARYGDTHGLHLDNRRDIWPYRDWVIDAFAKNMPFDQFTIEQLAGDLLPDPTQSQMVATGFNRCNVTTSEGGAIDEEFAMRYAVDRVDTTSTVWLGLTAGCAQCHDHKFDPLTQKEFFQLYAYFNNTTQPAMDRNIPDSPPTIRVYQSDQVKEQEATLLKELSEIEKSMKAISLSEKEAVTSWVADEVGVAKIAKTALEGRVFDGTVGEAPALDLAEPFSIALRVKVPAVVDRELDVLRTERYRIFLRPVNGLGIEFFDEEGQALGLKTVERVKPGSSQHVVFTNDGRGDVRGLGLYLNGKFNSERYANVYSDATEGTKTQFAGGQLKAVDFLTQLEFYDRSLTVSEVLVAHESGSIAGKLRKAPDKRNEKEQQSLEAAYLHRLSEPYREQLVKRSAAESALRALRANAPTTLVMGEKDQPAIAHVLERGEYDQPREEVSPGLPGFLPKPSEPFAPNRLGLAKWIVSPENPLTARVTVNRMWQELFGAGLVRTVEDFGTQGETASHPELLDWLAVEFVESGWDMKSVYRKMLLSRTYRQTTVATPELRKRDPDNRLLARGPRFRMDAEMIRDQALAASGLLIERSGGPSVKPYQPAGIWQTVGYTDSNTQTFFQDFGRDEHRRSVYTFWKRTAAPPNMVIFDAPNRESCTVRRERTNTPLQALVLMNDPQYVRAARHLATRVLNEKDQLDERLDYLSLVLRGRPMEEDEKVIVKSSLTQFRNAWESGDGEHASEAKSLLVDEVNPRFTPEIGSHTAIEVASWTLVASQMLNLDETVTKE